MKYFIFSGIYITLKIVEKHEKKIIIDEDWKTQVEAEKESLKREGASKPEDKPADVPQDAGNMPMPPASFEMLLSTLATEAMISLGAIPHPATGKNQAHPDQAKYLIDTIGVLQEKTKGNLTPGESQAIEGLLHQLRMVYVEVAAAGGAGETTGGEAASAP